MSELAQYRGTGKRKTSIARVILRPGDGGTWINGRTLEAYFPREALQTTATAPLRAAGVEGRFDIRARINGGGPSGQAGRSGTARQRSSADPELRGVLKREGCDDARRRAQEGRFPLPAGAAVQEVSPASLTDRRFGGRR
jgi:small subunit ribosomal protein S9